MDIKIIELSEKPELLDRTIEYFWKSWGNESNIRFYRDCIEHSLKEENKLPKFYVALTDNKIVGSYALLVNDLISRQDLLPWFACLYVTEEYRKNGIAEKLLSHGLKEAKSKGFDVLYLYTDLVNFYERRGWNHICNGFGVTDKELRIYSKTT
jgi:GNAT superfamily N-acetyltransferase